MFLRFVHVKVHPEHLDFLRRHYDERVVPALATTKGCLLAAFLQSDREPDECISMTLWQRAEDALEYERHGQFRTLLEEARPYLASAVEWEIRLTEDFRVQAEPVAEEPTVDGYTVRGTEGDDENLSKLPPLYVRITSPRIQEGMDEEFKRLYEQDVLPSLRKTPGCRSAFLVESNGNSAKFLSVTIWESKYAADQYEQSGLFASLIQQVQQTFSEVYHWKMSLEREMGEHVVTTDDVHVEGYRWMAGKQFPPRKAP